MEPYDPTEPIERLIGKLEKGRELAHTGGQTIAHTMMVSKGMTLLVHMASFNEDIREWIQQNTNLKTWATFKTLFHQSHREQRIEVTTTGKWGYTAAIQNIYGVPPPPLEEHHEVVDNLNTILQGMKTQSSNLWVLAQANKVLTRSNSEVMAQLAQMTMNMNTMQAKLNNLSSATTDLTRNNMKYYFWSCGSSYTHGGITLSANKAGHKEDAYYNKRMGVNEKGCKWRLGVTIIEIEIRSPKLSLIICIANPPNSPSKKTQEIADSGANIHLAKESTITMNPVIISNKMKARLPDEITTESSNTVPLQLPGLSK